METDSNENTGLGEGSPLIELSEPFENAAGLIQNLDVQGWVGVLHCSPGARRSSHWHRTDSHYLYVVFGRMNYYWRHVGETGQPHHVGVKVGQMVFTPPRVEHWTEFAIPTVLVSVSKLHRTHKQHEADLVRVEWFE